MRAWNVRHGQSRDGRIKIHERLIGNNRRNLRAKSRRAQIFMHNQTTAGFVDGAQHRLPCPTAPKSANRSPRRCGQMPWRLLRSALTIAPQVMMESSSPSIVDFRLPEGQNIIIAGIRPPRPGIVEHGAMFKKHHRVIAAQGGAQQPDRIFGV